MLFLLLNACSSSEKNLASDDSRKEIPPKVDREAFRTIVKNGFQVALHKKMSQNRVSGDVWLDANYLPKEYHLEIKKVPVLRFKKVEGFPTNPNEQLNWFALHHSQKLQQHLVSLEEQPLQPVLVNERSCFKKEVRGKEFGFPLEKCYFLRYYQIGEDFIAITAWTVPDNAKTFKKIAQYMGMAFEPSEDSKVNS